MTVSIIDHERENAKSFEDKSDAKGKKADLEGLADNPDEIELVNGSYDDYESYQSADPVEADGGKAAEVVADSSSMDVVNPSDIHDEEQFVTEIKGVPENFVVNMGTKRNKSIHIKKEGYYYLAAQMDLSFTTEPLNPSWEGEDSTTAAWRGIVTDSDGKEWSNVGTAHQAGEDMQGAEYNLDELAATRAACRALSMATGTGIASVEEMVQGDSE